MRITKGSILDRRFEDAYRKVKANWHLLDNNDIAIKFFKAELIYSDIRALIYYKFFGEDRLREAINYELENIPEKKRELASIIRAVLIEELRRNTPLTLDLEEFLDAQKI